MATETLSEYLERDITSECLSDIKQKVQDKYRCCYKLLIFQSCKSFVMFSLNFLGRSDWLLKVLSILHTVHFVLVILTVRWLLNWKQQSFVHLPFQIGWHAGVPSKVILVYYAFQWRAISEVKTSLTFVIYTAVNRDHHSDNKWTLEETWAQPTIHKPRMWRFHLVPWFLTSTLRWLRAMLELWPIGRWQINVYKKWNHQEPL